MHMFVGLDSLFEAHGISRCLTMAFTVGCVPQTKSSLLAFKRLANYIHVFYVHISSQLVVQRKRAMYTYYQLRLALIRGRCWPLQLCHNSWRWGSFPR